MEQINNILDTISEEDLLKLRIKDLSLQIQGTWLAECVEKLYAELEAKGIKFKPECYLADEWLTPDEEPVVGIPFFLAHPALMKLEKHMMLDVEGGNKQWCMQLLRHETGHAINYAYKLHAQKKWQQLFGQFHKDYPDTYRFRPYSKNFVRHLEDYYAQYHPDEDFAETFAVWLTPGIDWQHQYKGWKALQKLKFIDELMQRIKQKDLKAAKGKKFWQAEKLTSTLNSYYKKKRAQYAEDFLDFHDVNLKRIFLFKPDGQNKLPLAYKIISKYRKNIIQTVSYWTGEKKYIVDGLIKLLIVRTKDLTLGVSDSEPLAIMKISTYITTLMMNYMYTGRLRGKK
ncbi:MAG: putative zinc-binding metallopeptidase [Candidatus Omnitrophota bacterium]